MDDLDEPLILDGLRGWLDSQAALRGVPDVTFRAAPTAAGWYDTSVDDHEGAFCLINNGSALEDLVGNVVQVDTDSDTIWVYCLGGAALDNDIALARTAFARLGMLSEDELDVVVRRALRTTV